MPQTGATLLPDEPMPLPRDFWQNCQKWAYVDLDRLPSAGIAGIAGIAGTAGIAKCLDLLGPTKGSAGGYLINTEYTERARPQSAGKHTYLDMPSTG